MLFNPGMPLFSEENTNGTYGPIRQGNVGNIFQRIPVQFTLVCEDLDTAQVALFEADTEDSTPTALVDDCGNTMVFTQADLNSDGYATLSLLKLKGSSYVSAVITLATADTQPITLYIGSGTANGFLAQ